MVVVELEIMKTKASWDKDVIEWMGQAGIDFAGLGARMRPPMTAAEVGAAIGRGNPTRVTIARFEAATGLELTEEENDEQGMCVVRETV